MIGSNTTIAHPIIGFQIKKAVRERGAKLIVADPRRIPLVDIAALWLPLKPGTNVALLNGIMNVILAEGLADRDFIAARTEGFAALEEVLPRVPAGACRGDHRRPGRRHPRGRPALRRQRPGGDLLHDGDHPAHDGHRQRALARQPRDAHRQHRQARGGRQPAAGPEQRAGRLRHGRAAELLHRLPEGRGPGGARQVREGLGSRRCRTSRGARSARSSTARSPAP